MGINITHHLDAITILKFASVFNLTQQIINLNLMIDQDRLNGFCNYIEVCYWLIALYHDHAVKADAIRIFKLQKGFGKCSSFKTFSSSLYSLVSFSLGPKHSFT